MSTVNSRKRAAPGASPVVSYQQRMQQPYMADNAKPDPMMQWNAMTDGSDVVDGSTRGATQYGLVPAQQQYSSTTPAPSTSLTRRPNQALVSTQPRSSYDSSVEPWSGFGDENNALLQQIPGESLVAHDTVEVLEEMAAKAKREAQSKRKQIPPFVQKLSSFLEERKNEDLIRWSDKGDSFIVLDEDEFAKTLIPELFKHNNYASFVRQLNMYGFHKRVGLSDNSMRASERKNKSPSEYYNPFFRRGHPNLLWLINKPKGGSKAKKGSKQVEGEGESDEDNGHEDAAAQPEVATPPVGRPPPTSESRPLQKEITLIREELSKVRDQQKMILGAINQLQRNNNDLYSQALMFQSQHDRHQNSINAILNFLANVFRKTLEDGSNQNVGDIISSLMTTNQGTPQPHQQGSIFDLGDLVQSQVDPSSLGGAHKRARGLLPPIPNQSEALKASRSPAGASPPYHPIVNKAETGHVTELFDGSDASPSLRQELEANPHERMMKIINDHNATNTSTMDLPEAAEIVANAPEALNGDQRSKLVDFMSKQVSTPSSAAPSPAAPGQAAASMPPRGSTAGILPPRSPTLTPPSLQQISSNQVDLGQLQRLQCDQDAKIQELSELLGPLSPSGQIPGLGDGHEGFLDPPGVDMDQYFDSSVFLDDANYPADVNHNYAADGNDFNFSLEPGGGLADLGSSMHENGLVVAGGARDVVPSPAGTEEIQRDDIGDAASPQRDVKRRRMD